MRRIVHATNCPCDELSVRRIVINWTNCPCDELSATNCPRRIVRATNCPVTDNIPLTYTVETSNKFEALLQAEEPMTPGSVTSEKFVAMTKGHTLSRYQANYTQMRITSSTRSLFDAIRKLKQKFAPKIGSIKDESGYTLTDETSIKERWKRYVEKLYESKSSEHTQMLEPRTTKKLNSSTMRRSRKSA